MTNLEKINLDDLPMRVGLGQFHEITPSRLQFIKQCGCDDFQLNAPLLPGEERWEYEDLAGLVQQAAEAQLRLIAIENVPTRFYDQIMLGGDGRDKQLENMVYTIRNVARAGIPYLGYAFMPTGVWRTSQDEPVRGGAAATAFHYETARSAKPGDDSSFGSWGNIGVKREYTEEEIWQNYCWYLERILPVCEEVGLRLALHPDDPPVPSLGGVGRVFRNFENFRRAMETFDSPMHGLDFCHGCWSEMKGEPASSMPSAILESATSSFTSIYGTFKALSRISRNVTSATETAIPSRRYEPSNRWGFTASYSPTMCLAWLETRNGATAAGPGPWVISRRSSRRSKRDVRREPAHPKLIQPKLIARATRIPPGETTASTIAQTHSHAVVSGPGTIRESTLRYRR